MPYDISFIHYTYLCAIVTQYHITVTSLDKQLLVILF